MCAFGSLHSHNTLMEHHDALGDDRRGHAPRLLDVFHPDVRDVNVDLAARIIKFCQHVGGHD